MRLSRVMPNRDGFPVPIRELSLPKSRLDTTQPEALNNHHSLWTARNMGRFAISLANRNLAAYQDIIPVDTHNLIHARYEPAPMPNPTLLIDRLYEARYSGEQLRMGSAHNPTYKDITDEMWQSYMDEYAQLKDERPKLFV